MRQVWVIFQEEMRRAFRSPGTYSLLALFFVITGAFYLSVMLQASTQPQRASPLEVFWELQWLPNLLWVPLLTMRLLSQERRLGLLESTLATPTTPGAIVVGKYLSALAMYVLGWLSVGVYILVTQLIGLSSAELSGVLTPAAVWGGAIFCGISGVLFVALGLWCSSLTRNSILAGALTVCLLLLYMLLPILVGALGQAPLSVLKPFYHLNNLSGFAAGAIELSTVAAYFVVAAVILFWSMLSLEQKRD